MNLYLITQDVNQEYDTFDSAVVAAENEELARHTHPRLYGDGWNNWTWCDPTDVQVELLCEGYRGKAGVILASFNAG